ncbi:MBG domain-containing protein [Cyclobacterium xiamenense]|uniref:MBG domain-containing protein n=1 Tax=Cyclobacterium xiamenense TaxID=1297121 RepID=UPI0035D05007
MKILLKHLLVLVLPFLICHLAPAQTTVTFNEITNYIGTFGETYDNSGLRFSVTKTLAATPNSGIKATENNGYLGSVALNDSNLNPNGINQWTIRKTDGSSFQFISIFLQEGGVGASTTGTISAFKAGNPIGTAKAITFNSASNGLKTFDNDPDFYDVDEVRINADDIYFFLDQVTTGAPFSPLDEDPPVVTGISVNGAPPTTATTVSFTVNFSKVALNVSLDDFLLTTSGTTGTLSALSGSGNSYQVTATGISGEGFIRLDLKGSTNITNEDLTGGVPAFTTGTPHAVSACFTELLEGAPDGSTTFSSNGLSFSLGTGLEVESRLGFGAGNSNRFIKNTNSPGSFSIRSASLFTLNTVDLFLSDLSNGDNPTGNGTLTVTGKKDGATVFTILKTAGFPVDATQNGGFFTLDFSTDGTENFRNTNVDEVEFTIADGFQQLLLDNLSFCAEVPDTDIAAPAIQRILVDGSPGSTASSVSFSVLFDENAFNVSLDDFSLVKTGSATGTLNQLSGSGSSYLVTVTGISGEGSLQLRLTSGTNIADALGNTGPLEYVNGQIHLVGACYSESFEDETDGSVSFSGNGQTFALSGNWAVRNRIGFGANGSANYLESSGVGPYTIQVSGTPVAISKIGLYLSSFVSGVTPTNDGALTLTGKLDGNTVYTIQKNSGFPTDFGGTGGYFSLDFATDGPSDYSGNFIDELVLEISGAFTYLALDNFDFCLDTEAPTGYSVTIDQSEIDAANQDQIGFTFAGAETGTNYSFSFASSGGGTPVTGSGTIATPNQQVPGIDLTSLPNGLVVLTVSLTDLSGNTGSEATAQVTKFVNTLPEINPDPITAPSYQENAADLLIAGSIVASDADGDPLVRAVIRFEGSGKITGDELSLGDPSPFTIQEVDDNTFELTGTATATVLTDILRDLSFRSTSDDPSLGGTETERIISIVVEDANGGLSVLANGTNNLSIPVTAVNDAPELALPTNESTVSDQPLTFSISAGNGIVASDPDVGTNALLVELSVTNGNLDLATTTGLSFLQGTGSGDNSMEFSGSLTDINNALDGLVFTNTSGFVGEALLSIQVNDQGNTGTGGALSVNNNLSIQVNAPNAAPVASGVSASGTTAVGESLTGTYTYADAESDAETGSSFQWWIADDALGSSEAAIAGQSSQTLNLLTDYLGRFISFEVTPSDGNNSGVAVKSAYVGPVFTLPMVTTTAPGSIAFNAASLGGEVQNDQFSPITERGIVINASGNPDLTDQKVSMGSGTGIFSATVSGLNPNTLYYVRAFATNAAGTSFGAETSFTTEKQALTLGGTFQVENKTYDGTVQATMLNNNLQLIGPQTGDEVLLTNLVVEFADSQSGANKPVAVVSAGLSGADADDYTLTLSGAPLASASILPKSLNITATEGLSKTYGSLDPSFTFSSSGFVNGEDESLLTGALSRESGEGVGNYALTLGTLSAGGNYTLDFTSAAFGINQQTLSITAEAGQSKTYGQADPTFSFSSNGFVNGEDESILTGALSREPGEDVGNYALTLGDLSAGANYALDFTSADFGINQQTLSITTEAGQSKTYGQADPTFTFSSSGFVNGEDESLLTGTLSRESGEDVGSYALTIGDLSAGANYALDFTPADFGINQQTLDITADVGQSKTYGQADPTFTFSSNGFVNGEDESIFTGALSREPGEDVGSYALTLGDLTAGANYALDFTPAAFGINQQTLSITAEVGQSKTYGQADPTFTFSSSGFVNGEDESILTGALSRESGEDVGNYALTIGDLSAGANYALDFTPADFGINQQTLNITADVGQSKTYGQADPTFTFSSNGFVNGEDESMLTGALSREPGDDVGSYALTLGDLSAGGNYALDFTPANFAINQQTLSITADAGQSKTYGQTDPIFTFSSSGFVNGEDESLLTGALSRESGENVGSYALTIGDLSAGANYALDFTPADFGINQQTLSITAEAGQSKTYGQADPTFTFSSSGFVNGEDESIFTGALSRESGEDVGSYALTIGDLSAGANYALDFTPADFGINQQTLTITADADQSKTYGQADPTFTFSSNGFVNGEDESLLTGALSRESGEDVGSYALTLGDLSAGANYALDFTSADFGINQQTLNITAEVGQSKTYGQADPIFTFSSSGFVNGEDESIFTGALSREPGEDVGSYALTLGDLSAGGNYALDFTPAAFGINQQTLSITADAGQSKTYGQADPIFSFSSSGFVNGEDESILTGALSRESGEDVGSYALTIGDLSAGGNYALDFTSAAFGINQQTLSITADAGQSKIYGQADPTFTFSSSGFVNGEDESILTGALSRESGEDVGSYALTIGDLSAGGNYALDFTSADFGINQQTLSITAEAGQSKTYGQADPTFTFSSSGFVNGEDESIFTGALSRESGEDVGSYALTIGDLSAGANYALDFTPADFGINQQTLTITADADQSKTYGQADPTFTFSSNGFVNGEDESLLTGALSRESGEDVGSYALTLGDLSAGGNYALDFTSADFGINQQTLSITAEAGQSKTYGQADPTFTFSSNGFVNGEDESIFTGALSREPGEDVGNYALTIGDLSAGANYALDFTPAAFGINQQTLSITADAGQSKTYGQADPIFTFSSSGFVNGEDESILTGALSREPGEDVGSYALTIGDLSAGGNYALDFTSAAFGINQQTLSITAEVGQSKTYGQADPTFTFSSSGFVNGEDESILTGALSRESGEVVGSYALTIGDLSAGANYALDFTPAAFGINQQTLSITADAGQSKTYGQADPIFTFSSSGFVNGEDESIFTGALSREPGEDVGSYALTLGDLSAGGNYALDFTPADFGINQQTLSITADAGLSKTYGQADPIFTFSSGGFVNGEDESILTGALRREPGEGVGNYAMTLGTLSAGGNYVLSLTENQFQILPRTKNGTLVLDATGMGQLEPSLLLDQPLLPGQTLVVETTQFNCGNLGTREIAVGIRNSNGQVFSSTAILRIEDQTAPVPVVANLPPLRFECSIESLEPPTSLDNCGGTIPGIPAQALPILESTVITWTFTDLSGNKRTQMQEIIIEDTTAPIIESVPTDQTIYLNQTYALPDFTKMAVAQDNCELSGFVQLPAPGTVYTDSETLRVQLIATDVAGNQSEAEFVLQLVNLNLVEIENPALVSIAWNTPLETLSFPETIRGQLSNGEAVDIPVQWTIPVLDTKVAGLYQYTGILELGEIQNPDQLDPVLSILVADKALPQEITLSANTFEADSDLGTRIGTLGTLDPADDVHIYSLIPSSNDNQYFGIAGTDLFWNSSAALPGKSEFTVDVRSTDRAGNTISQTFTLRRNRMPLEGISVPNTFTPNGDGFNDDWGIDDLRYYLGAKVAVYERSGKRVFYTENPDMRWDGTYLGKQLPTGTYFWVISLDETNETRRGVLTIFND